MTGRPCADCFSGTLHKGTPTGTVETIHGLPTYVAHPEEGVTPKGIVVMIPDAFGWEMVNNRIVCDHYAKRGGFLVYLPDFMNGKAMAPSMLGLMDKITQPAPWLTTLVYKPFYVLRALSSALPFFFRCRTSVCKPRIFGFFTALRTSPPPFPTPALKIGAVGFCWGGRYTILLCQNVPSSRTIRHASQAAAAGKIESLVDCGFTAHPSMVSVPADVEQVDLPLCVMVGEEDMAMGGKEILRMKEILEVKLKGDHEVHLLEGAKHGFAVRSHEEGLQMEYAEKAEEKAVDWFGKWFS